MEYKVEMKSAPGRDKVEILGETFDKGMPESEDEGKWRQKLADREAQLAYLRTGERYWYGEEWFGSEKRKNPV